MVDFEFVFAKQPIDHSNWHIAVQIAASFAEVQDGTRNLPHIVAELSHPSDAQQNDDRNKFSHTNPYNA